MQLTGHICIVLGAFEKGALLGGGRFTGFHRNPSFVRKLLSHSNLIKSPRQIFARKHCVFLANELSWKELSSISHFIPSGPTLGCPRCIGCHLCSGVQEITRCSANNFPNVILEPGVVTWVTEMPGDVTLTSTACVFSPPEEKCRSFMEITPQSEKGRLSGPMAA